VETEQAASTSKVGSSNLSRGANFSYAKKIMKELAKDKLSFCEVDIMANDKFNLGFNYGEQYNGLKISAIQMCSEFALIAKDEGLEIIYNFEYCGDYSIHWAIVFKDKIEISRWNLKLCQGFEWEK
jgi:hypothetical protein